MTEARAWQRMLSGRRLDLLDPSPLDVEIEDIAHGLAFVARWNGQTHGDHPYSVAEHSLLVEEIFCRLAPRPEPRWQLAALLHDAPEYVIGDMISPVKGAIGPSYAGTPAQPTTIKSATPRGAIINASATAGITLNKNAIPYDPQKPMVTSGIRVGSPTVTTQGMAEREMKEIAGLIARAARTDLADEAGLADVRSAVTALVTRYPAYAR